MSKVITKVYDRVYDILFRVRKLELSIHDARNEILSISEIAIVDRRAELPFPGEKIFDRLNYKVDLMSSARGSVIEAYRMAEQDMSEAGWVKEVKA